MDLSVFEFIFVFVVEGDAVLVDEGGDGGFPERRSDEGEHGGEDPVLGRYSEYLTSADSVIDLLFN